VFLPCRIGDLLGLASGSKTRYPRAGRTVRDGSGGWLPAPGSIRAPIFLGPLGKRFPLSDEGCMSRISVSIWSACPDSVRWVTS